METLLLETIAILSFLCCFRRTEVEFVLGTSNFGSDLNMPECYRNAVTTDKRKFIILGFCCLRRTGVDFVGA